MEAIMGYESSDGEVVEIARETVGILNKLYNWDKYSDQHYYYNYSSVGDEREHEHEPMSCLAKIHGRLAKVALRRAEASGRDLEEVFAEIDLEFHRNEAKIMINMEVDPREAVIKDRVVISEQDIGQLCTVCLEEFQLGEEVNRTTCMLKFHYFHGLCLWKWLAHHKTCPTCRYTLLI